MNGNVLTSVTHYTDIFSYILPHHTDFVKCLVDEDDLFLLTKRSVDDKDCFMYVLVYL